MLRRNLEGLLSKCYRYGALRGVELGIYIKYMESGQFLSYESENFSYQSTILEQKRLPGSKNYSPSHLALGIAKKLQGTSAKTATAPAASPKPTTEPI
ncbi:hypothetical protein SPI_01416 [Niveomyces insectorum RCEF 264]|uniref:Uncharacterized protein n=1 Tax=Niveomyces insectorum RCEF 264 TaxID=1081102 RepID=A0A162MTS2_9HYPO|nr:hypothetical protein SPI_01416 [Niveomyces insectorum RCEF 264]